MSECSALEQLHTTADRRVAGLCPDNMGEDNCGKGWPNIEVHIYLVKVHILHRHGAVLSFCCCCCCLFIILFKTLSFKAQQIVKANCGSFSIALAQIYSVTTTLKLLKLLCHSNTTTTKIPCAFKSKTVFFFCKIQ